MVGRLKLALDLLSSVLMVLLAGAMLHGFWGTSRTPVRPSPTARPADAARAEAPLPTEPLSLEGAAVKGNTTARVVVIVYSDFQCPYCAKFAQETLPSIEKDFVETGKVKLAFRHLPLESLHPQAFLASAGAECAGRSGLFWEMHDQIFKSPKEITDRKIVAWASGLGIREKDFATCLSSGAVADRIRADVDEAKRLALSGTPSFFVGLSTTQGKVQVLSRLVGAQSAAEFGRVIGDALKKAQ